MTEHRAMIGQMTVNSKFDFIVYGKVRGFLGGYSSVRAAQAAARQDRNECRSIPGNCYSDVTVYCWDDEDGWCRDATQE